MFSFLKDKLKSAISKISKKVEEEAPKEEVEQEVKSKPAKEKPEKQSKKKEKKISPKEKKKIEEKLPEEEDIEIIEEEIVPEEVKEDIIEEKKEEFKEEKKGFFAKLKEKFTSKEEIEEKEQEIKEEKKEPEEEKKGFFGIIKEKITTTKISEEKFEDLFYDLELALLENNVAFEVVEKIKEDLKKDIVDKPIKRGEIEEEIKSSLKESIEDLFLVPKIDLLEKIKEKKEKPYIIVFFGQNGSGKTTSISKLGYLLKKNGFSVVFAAGDTFRKGSIEQIKEWGERLNIKVIAHDYGSDSAAVAFDGKKYCESHKTDVLLIDTAGRQHSNVNLIKEMEKIVRVVKPDLKIFVGEAIVGNDAVSQAEDFNKSVGIDGIILAKADIDEKGGAIVSVSHVTHRPIIYLGTGQQPQDLKEFNKEEIVKSLGL